MIKTAVIGFGLSARVFHLPFLATNANFQLVGISTAQPDAAKFWPDAQIYADADSLLQQTDASLIVITAPNRAHFSLAKTALLAGKDVLVEKPLAVTMAEALALQALAVQQQRKLAVFHNRRFDDDFVALQQLLQCGQLGTVQLMYSRFDRFRPQVQARWKESAEPGNGVLYDLAPHLLDQAIVLFGRPDSITASCQSLRGSPEPVSAGIDYFQLRLDYLATAARPARQVVLSSSPFCAHPSPRFELHGTRGSAVSFGLDPQEQLLRDTLQLTPAQPTAIFTSEKWQQRSANRHAEIWTASGKSLLPFATSHYGVFYQQLAFYLQDQGPAPIALSDAILGLELMELALQSSTQQRTVSVPVPEPY